MAMEGYYGNSTKSSGTQDLRPFQFQAAKPRPLSTQTQMALFELQLSGFISTGMKGEGTIL